MYQYLFSPIKINKLEIKNRIVYPALGLIYSYDGKLNDRYLHYFRERARGEAGIVTVGPVGVDFHGSGVVALSLADDENIPSFKNLTGIIKKEGSRAWVQLFHAGAYSYSILINGEKSVAPSEVYSRYSKQTPRELTIAEIKQIQEYFVRAAERAKEAGFDGVEIIASAGYLITQFLSPLKNLRKDEYGGSFENRTRFPREIIELMRKRLGPDYPITIRIAGNDFVPGSNTDMETPRFAEVYERAGVDAISVTGGWHESRVPQLPMETPRGVFAYLALNVKRAVSVPVMASNRIADPATADQVIRDGVADMVNLGRVLIADPEWPRKAREGRVEEIRPCVACNQGCTDSVFSGKPVFCLANPMAGYEGERRIEKTQAPKNIMVIGAGPAGLEAALTAAERGHRVELFERDSDIGGQLWIAGAPPFKHELLELIRYYRTMLKMFGIKIHLNQAVDAGFIRDKKPDHVFIAEGAEPLHPRIDGIDDGRVLSAWKVLRKNPLLGKKIAVIGGGSVGLETALFLADKGTLPPELLHFLFAYEAESAERLRELVFRGSKEVTVFEMLPKVGKDVGRSTRWILMGNLERYGIGVITGAKVTSLKNGTVSFEREGKQESLAFDNIVTAFGSRPVKKLATEMEKEGIPHTVLGDGVQVGKINDAIHGGFLAAAAV